MTPVRADVVLVSPESARATARVLEQVLRYWPPGGRPAPDLADLRRLFVEVEKRGGAQIAAIPVPNSVKPSQGGSKVDSVAADVDHRRSGRPLDVDDCAREMGRSRSTVYRRIRAGELRSVREGGRRVVKPSDLDAYFDGLT